MKSCVPCGKYILAVFVMRKIKEIVVFLMINSMCSLCRIRYGNFFVFVVDGVPLADTGYYYSSALETKLPFNRTSLLKDQLLKGENTFFA